MNSLNPSFSTSLNSSINENIKLVDEFIKFFLNVNEKDFKDEFLLSGHPENNSYVQILKTKEKGYWVDLKFVLEEGSETIYCIHNNNPDVFNVWLGQYFCNKWNHDFNREYYKVVSFKDYLLSKNLKIEDYEYIIPVKIYNILKENK